eukprot:403342832
MDFETRMRKIIKDLVSPVIDRAQEDRQQILELKSDKNKLQEKVTTLENSIFKSRETNTIFDDFDQKFVEFEVSCQKQIEKIRTQMVSNFNTIQDKIFETNNRISTNEILKQQFEVYQEKQAKIDEQMTKYKNEINEQFGRLQHDYNTNYFDAQNVIKYLTNKVTALYPDMDQLRHEVKQSLDSQRNIENKFDDMNKQLIHFDHKKISLEAYKQDQNRIQDTINTLQQDADDTRNLSKSLENWIEKYQPLKIHHMIIEALGECLNRKGRIKLSEYDFKVSEILRQKILADHGNPKLKEKIIDLITKYETETPSGQQSMIDMQSNLGAGLMKKVMTSALQSKFASNNASAMRKIKDNGLDDEDSENIEDLKYQILREVQVIFDDNIRQLKFDLSKQSEKRDNDQKAFFDKNQEKVNEVSILLNELKEEQDRQNTRILHNQNEMVQYNRSLINSIRKVKLEQVNINEDLISFGSIIQTIKETAQNLINYLESQASVINDHFKQDNSSIFLTSQKNQQVHSQTQNSQVDKESLNKAQESLKLCGILTYKRQVKGGLSNRQFAQSTDTAIKNSQTMQSSRRVNHHKKSSISEIHQLYQNDQQNSSRYQSEVKKAYNEKQNYNQISQASQATILFDISEHKSTRDAANRQSHYSRDASIIEAGELDMKDFNQSTMNIDSQEYTTQTIVDNHKNTSKMLELSLGGLNSLKINENIINGTYNMGIFGKKAAALHNIKINNINARNINRQALNTGRVVVNRNQDSIDLVNTSNNEAKISAIFNNKKQESHRTKVINNGDMLIQEAQSLFGINQDSPQRNKRNHNAQSSIFPDILQSQEKSSYL